MGNNEKGIIKINQKIYSLKKKKHFKFLKTYQTVSTANWRKPKKEIENMDIGEQKFPL